MGLRQARLGVSTKALRWCIGVKGLPDGGKGDLIRRGGEAVRCEGGDDDWPTVIESARVEQVHKAHELAVTGKHGGHKET